MPRNKRRGLGGGGGFGEELYSERADRAAKRLRPGPAHDRSAFEEWLEGALARAVGKAAQGGGGARGRDDSNQDAAGLRGAPDKIEPRLATVEDNVQRLMRRINDAVSRFESPQTVHISETVTQQLEVRITEHVMSRVVGEFGTGMRALWNEMEQLKARTTQELTIRQQTQQVIEQRVETHHLAVGQVSSSMERVHANVAWLSAELATCQRTLAALETRVAGANTISVADKNALEPQTQDRGWTQREQPLFGMQATPNADAPLPRKGTGTGGRKKSARGTASPAHAPR